MNAPRPGSPAWVRIAHQSAAVRECAKAILGAELVPGMTIRQMRDAYLWRLEKLQEEICNGSLVVVPTLSDEPEEEDGAA